MQHPISKHPASSLPPCPRRSRSSPVCSRSVLQPFCGYCVRVWRRRRACSLLAQNSTSTVSSRRSACRLLVLCLVCCYIISTRFCRLDRCDLLIDLEKNYAGQSRRRTHNATQRNATQHASAFQSPSSIGRLTPVRNPPAASLPPAPPSPRHPCAGPSLYRVFHAPSRISPYLGLPLPCPILAVACPVGLVFYSFVLALHSLPVASKLI